MELETNEKERKIPKGILAKNLNYLCEIFNQPKNYKIINT